MTAPPNLPTEKEKEEDDVRSTTATTTSMHVFEAFEAERQARLKLEAAYQRALALLDDEQRKKLEHTIQEPQMTTDPIIPVDEEENPDDVWATLLV